METTQRNNSPANNFCHRNNTKFIHTKLGNSRTLSFHTFRDSKSSGTKQNIHTTKIHAVVTQM